MCSESPNILWGGQISLNPYFSRGFTHYSFIKIGVGKQKEQVGGSPSYFVHSAGSGMKKIAILRVGTPKNLDILMGGSPKIRMRTSPPLTFQME